MEANEVKIVHIHPSTRLCLQAAQGQLGVIAAAELLARPNLRKFFIIICQWLSGGVCLQVSNCFD